ncbi:E3 ubiquitin-protein ligase RNF186 [Erythrolamprus reginae]|uniref:E3 ubiquitin-protein ligase RNF186 n=1 Tax=Erythrolamprus reginae TaxID=121349 RepID=UPI00396CBEA2
MDDLQPANEGGKVMDRSDILGETSRTDDNPRTEGCSIQPCNKTVDPELGNPEKETSTSLHSGALMVSPAAPFQQCPFRASASDMTCLICFHQFSLARVPKVLACQHAFCAMCLRMLLRQEDHTWIVRCPLCRKATVVFGGLICSLRNLQHVTEQLGPPHPDAEVAGNPGTAGVWHTQQHPSPEMQPPDSGVINQVAIKRLILLLLLVSVLIVFILPFTNTGILTWFLCFVVVIGGLICAVLCWDPSWRRPSFSLPLWTKKVNPAA